jgi:hypothetical protein
MREMPMPVKPLSYHQRYYRSNHDYQERSRKSASERYAKIKQEGGDEMRIIQIRKALYQRRSQISHFLDKIEHQEKHIFPLVEELQALLKRRGAK